MSRRAKIVSAVIVVLAVAGIAGYIVLRSASGGPQIETATVRTETLSVSVQASGKVQAGRKVDLFPPAAGTLAEVLVKDGQTVQAGQQIAVMDTTPFELQVEQAASGVRQAEASLDSIDAQAATSQDLSAAKASVSAAKAAWEAAKAALASVGSQAPNASQLEAAHAATVAAKAAYDATNAAYLAAKVAVETSATPTALALETLQQAEIVKEQAYAAYLGAKSTEEQLENADLSDAKKQAQAAVSQALAAYEGAKAQLEKLERASTTAGKAAARAALAQAQSALTLANDNLDKATLVAPIDGVVFFNPTGVPGADGSTPKPSAGSVVAPQAAPFSIVDLSAVRFTAEIDEADIDRIKADMTGEISLDAFPGETFKSRVVDVRPAAQLTATGGTIFPVEMSLDETGKNVLIGMKGDASISVSSVGDALVMPIEALFDQNGQSYVYVVEAGKLKRADIQAGAITDMDVQVLGGLKDGDVVALSGPTQFTDGMSVRSQ